MKKNTKLIVLMLIISLFVFQGCNKASELVENDLKIDGQGIANNEWDDDGEDVSDIENEGNGASDGLTDQGGAVDNPDVGSQAADGIEDAGDVAEEETGDENWEVNREDILNDIVASMEKEFSAVPDPYLTGWTYSLKIAGISDEVLQGIDMGSLFESMVVAQEFKYNVGMPLKVSYTPNGIFMMVGKVNEVADPFASQTEVSATNTTHSVSHKGVEDVVFENDKVIVQIASIMTSSKLTEFIENVEIEGWTTVNGTLNFKRLGPGSRDEQTDIDEDFDVEGGQVNAIIPQGDYALVFRRDDFELEIPIDEDYIFVTEGHEAISIEALKTITGNVYKGSETSDEKKPVEGAIVELIPLITDVGIEGDFTDETDAKGEYSIEDVPLGVYQLFVNGVPQHKVVVNQVGNGEKPIEDVYLPGDVFDVTVHMIMIRSTVQMTFKEVYIGDEYAKDVMQFPGVSTIVKGQDVYPNSTDILALSVPANHNFWDNYFTVLKTDELVSNYVIPNAYYIDFNFGVDYLETEYNMPEWADGASVGLPFYEGDIQSGLLNTEAFEDLLYKGIPFTYTNVTPFATTTISIVPHE